LVLGRRIGANEVEVSSWSQAYRFTSKTKAKKGEIIKMNRVKSIFIAILPTFLLCGLVFGASLIKNDVRVSKDGGGDYILTSLPQELHDSQEFEYLSRIGAVNCVLICREDGRWDKEFLILSRLPSNIPLFENAKKHLQIFMNLCDEVVPNERILAICYYADYEELIIYLHPDQWKDKKIHEEVSNKLNNALHK